VRWRQAIWWTRDYAWAALVWLSASFAPASPEHYTTGTGRPVVVLPGVYEDWRFLRPLIVPLHRRGHPVHVVSALGHNRAPLAQGAAAVRALLAERDLHDVVVVGHSKGGLIGTLALRDDTEGRVAALVTICTPFHGSSRSRLLPLPSLRPFVPGHPSLAGMNRAEARNARITSICSRFDEHVPEGSELAGADNVHLDVTGHFRPIGHPSVLAEIVRVLARP
jgi:pimeloyl-ACP methyl ester carboxylesterase